MIESIQIRNPRVRQLVAEELKHPGVGRNFTEAAENLILDAIDRRRAERERNKPRKLRQAATA